MNMTKPGFEAILEMGLHKPDPSAPHFKLHVTANGKGGGEEEFNYQTAFDLDDMLGIMKTYMEYADHTSSFVFTVVREP
jgi:hypothetical protein